MKPLTRGGAYCEVCGSPDLLGELWWEGMESMLIICQSCHDDLPKLRAWVIREMVAWLESNPDYERLPNGNWRRRLHDQASKRSSTRQ